MNLIKDFSKDYNLTIIEDCAEALGAKYDNKYVGTFGDIGCFSFFGNKIITTGEGGMCVTNDKKSYERMKFFRNNCADTNKNNRYWHSEVGYNYRMSNLNAAFGLAQLENIDKILNEKKRIHNTYSKYFLRLKRDNKLLEKNISSPCIITILVENSNQVIKYLKNNLFIVYECKGDLYNRGFQISLYGLDRTDENITELIKLLNKTFKKN
jgi:perosamine synthetase